MKKRTIVARAVGVFIIAFGITGHAGSSEPGLHERSGKRTGTNDGAAGVEHIAPTSTSFPEAKRYIEELRGGDALRQEAAARQQRDKRLFDVLHGENGSIASLLAQLLPSNLYRRTRACAGDYGDVFRVGIFGWSTREDRYLADGIAAGLSRVPFIRISDAAQMNIAPIEIENHVRRDGRLDNVTVQRFGARYNLHAIGVVITQEGHPYYITTVHLVCTRTLRNVIAARIETPPMKGEIRWTIHPEAERAFDELIKREEERQSGR